MEKENDKLYLWLAIASCIFGVLLFILAGIRPSGTTFGKMLLGSMLLGGGLWLLICTKKKPRKTKSPVFPEIHFKK